MARCYETNENHDGTRPTELSTLVTLSDVDIKSSFATIYLERADIKTFKKVSASTLTQLRFQLI